MTSRTRILLVAILGFLASQLGSQAQTGLTAETWNNLTQDESVIILQQEGISDRAADSTTTITDANLAGPTAAGTGTRLRGSITPAITDTYTFWVSGDSNVALWISDDASRFNKKLVCYSLKPTAAQSWDAKVSQRSVPIQLTGGQSYYLEAQVMDKDGGGHLEIAWRGQSGRYALDLNGATATQSSTKWGGEASRAIDGNSNGSWGKGEVTRTNNDLNTWWQVDFGQDREINQVVVYNHDKDQHFLSNFRISVLDANDVELIGQDFFTTSGNVGDSMTWDLPTSYPTARKIKIQFLGQNLAGNGTLMLAEVEAYGVGLVSGQVNLREIVPQAVLNTLAADPDDANDNNLSDAWETSTGLAASSHPEALLEYGDPDKDGLSNYQEQWYGSDPLTQENVADGLTRYIWMGVNNSSISKFVSDSKFYSYPNAVTHAPGVDEVYSETTSGVRFRGTIIAPVTGSYRFWISSKSSSELWLADGSITEPGTSTALTNRYGKRRLASSGDWGTAEDDFDFRLSQRSEVINLVQGQGYYIEVLHSRGHSSGHVSLAWEYPGQARQIIPALSYLSGVQLASDADDDNLPDAWETANNIDSTDNGYTDLSNGEYGDPDGDGLSNLREYQLGTNPKNADTDGDGLSDDEELNLYGSDPLVSNVLAPVAINLPALNEYTTATGSWYTDANGSLSANDRRGGITYTFTVTEPGVHEVVLEAGAIHRYPWQGHALAIELTLNGDSEPFAKDSIISRDSLPETMRAITPWLDAGTHTLTVYHNNYDAALRMRIDSLAIKRLGGLDIDANGIPDWVEDKAALANAVTRVATTSRTSPLSIEGITEQISSTSLSVLAPGETEAVPLAAVSSINDSFFADVPLDEAGAVTFDASFLNGVVTESHSITWTATNLFEGFAGDTLHIRAGDALRLDAWSGSAPDGLAFTVTMDGVLLEDANQNTTHTSGVPFVSTFATAGSYSLVATHNGQTATVTLEVHAADFGASHVVSTYSTRAWTPTTLSSDAIVQADERILFTETSTGTPRTFDVKAEEPINRHVIARIPNGVDGAPSAILARGTVHAFELAQSGQTKDAQVVTQYADGTYLMSVSMVGVNLPPNLLVKLTIKYQGSLFTNGSMVLELRPEDFDANGMVTVYIESSEATATKLCHTARTFIEQ